MKDKIYIVVSEWKSASGEFGCEVIMVSYDLMQANECLQKERDIILEESYNTTFERCYERKDIQIKYSDNLFFIAESYNRWDSITIYEKEIEQRDFITIQFDYDGEIFSERIYLDQIDRDHYDDHWDWWFGANEDSKHPELCFELFGDKDDEGNIIYDAFEINIYENVYSWSPITRVSDYEITQSWIGDKNGFIKYYKHEQGI